MRELVIKISEEIYKNIQNKSTEIQAEGYTVENAILNGTPLPKGHGRLVDIDLLRDQVSHDEREAFSHHQVWLLLSVHNKEIPTILDADETYKNRLYISEEDYKNRVIGVDLNHVEEKSKETANASDWIKCSDRLPDLDVDVLGTRKGYGDVVKVARWETGLEECKWEWVKTDDIEGNSYEPDAIIAWMPLPEGFKEER